MSKLDKNVSNVLKAGQFTKHHSSPIDKAAKKFKHLSLGTDDTGTSFDLPLLVVVHKQEQTVAQGTNQLRMYLTASVAFLGALGITKFPVFGLITKGKFGVVMCCELETVDLPEKKGKEKVDLPEKEGEEKEILPVSFHTVFSLASEIDNSTI